MFFSRDEDGADLGFQGEVHRNVEASAEERGAPDGHVARAPIARVEPVVQHKSGKRPLGTMRGRLKIKTEIVRSDFEGDFAAR
ncbi:hypothetical protein BH18VER1_BH18VER1_22820 [soil metagenome]